RDVSPHNIFVTYEGQVKLVDFGVAKAVTSAALTRTGALKGKVPYMSPEQATGGTVDRRADIFAMGVVLWNVLSETRLWQGMPELTVLQNLVAGRIPTPDEGLASAPAELRAIVARAMAFEPADRYATAAEMRRDLERYLQSTGASLTPREVGDYVATYFAEERSAMRALIDSRLRAAASAPTGELSAMPMSRPGVVADLSGGMGNSGLTPVSAPSITPSGWQHTGARPMASPAMASSMVSAMPYPMGGGVPYPSTLPGAVNPAYPPAPPTAGSRAMIPLALLLGACVVSGTLWFALRARPPAPAEPVAAAPVAERADKPAPASAPTGPVKLEIEADPPETKLFLDGKPLEKNPYAGSFDRDERVHVLRAEAHGFVSRERELVFQRDAKVTFTLERERDKPPGPGRTIARPPPHPPATPP
ncbi:MAG TPA: protein kinase, partial [Polyangiaceae bacterium]|nr:protein kinase [Polyangiaceae bacterium]